VSIISPLIAIYGATGHTGRLVAAELLSRGRPVVLAGRNDQALRDLAEELGSPGLVQTHQAALDDRSSLRKLAENASVLIHCAGPFSQTGEPVASAAAAAGCNYVDHAVEVLHVKRVFDTLQETAQRTGAVMIPGLSFYGGLGDLLAGAVTQSLADVDRVTIAYAVSGWRMTTGAKNTATEMFAETERVSFVDGEIRTGYVEPRNVVFPFPPPIGPRTMIAPVPFCEVVTIPRHVATRSVEAQLTADTFTEEQTFTSEHVDAETRALSTFTIAVQAIAGHGSRAGQLVGRDLWRAGALASVEAALRLSDGHGTGGVHGPGELFPAAEFLRALERLGAFEAHLP
jgi:saccharopine dehydrogenase-like NADP-dependent oxidoreductase